MGLPESGWAPGEDETFLIVIFNFLLCECLFSRQAAPGQLKNTQTR